MGQERNNKGVPKSYYDAGNVELATETPLTVKRLEAVRWSLTRREYVPVDPLASHTHHPPS